MMVVVDIVVIMMMMMIMIIIIIIIIINYCMFHKLLIENSCKFTHLRDVGFSRYIFVNSLHICDTR